MYYSLPKERILVQQQDIAALLVDSVGGRET